MCKANKIPKDLVSYVGGKVKVRIGGDDPERPVLLRFDCPDGFIVIAELQLSEATEIAHLLVEAVGEVKSSIGELQQDRSEAEEG